MKGRKVTGILLSIILVTGMMSGCGDTKQAATTQEISGTITLKEGEWKDVYYNEELNEDEVKNVKGEKNPEDSSYLNESFGVGFGCFDIWKEQAREDVLSNTELDIPSDEEFALVYCSTQAVEKFNAVYEDLNSSQEDIKNAYNELIQSGFPLFGIYRREIKEENGPLFSESDFGTRFAYAEKMGTFAGKEYYFVYNDTPPIEGYTETELKDIQVVLDSMDATKEHLILFTPPERDLEAEARERQEKVAGVDMSQFETTSLDGSTVTQDIFKDYDITMVNIWATWCGPCRKELPAIQAAYEQLPENVNIISICEDATEETELANALVEKTGMKYMVLSVDEALEESVMSHISAFPTTFLVDSEGHLVGTPIIGIPSGDDVTQAYLDYINSGLE